MDQSRHVIASGEHHIDVRGTRADECRRIHDWIAELVEEERPDAFLSGGDIYDRASTPADRKQVAEWLTQIAEVCPVVIARGNHDRPEDVALMRRLKTRHPVIVEESCGVHVVGGVAVAAVAWPSKASLMAMLGRDIDSTGIDDAARLALQDVFRWLRTELDKLPEDMPRLMLGHFMVDGARVSTGQPLIGAELRVGLEDLALAGCDLVVAAHIHKPQDWQFGGTDVVYTGSPYRTAYGETEAKSVLSVTLEPGSDSMWERTSTPAQEMVLLEREWSSANGLGSDDTPAWGPRADVRLRYRVAADERDAAKAAAAEWREQAVADGADRVTVEEVVIQTARARAPEVAAAESLPEKLRLLWAQRGEDMTDREPRVLGRLQQLEEAS
ncbi:MAG: metallophosphoesterase [Myxococcota bacterium]